MVLAVRRYFPVGMFSNVWEISMGLLERLPLLAEVTHFSEKWSILFSLLGVSYVAPLWYPMLPTMSHPSLLLSKALLVMALVKFAGCSGVALELFQFTTSCWRAWAASVTASAEAYGLRYSSAYSSYWVYPASSAASNAAFRLPLAL